MASAAWWRPKRSSCLRKRASLALLRYLGSSPMSVRPEKARTRPWLSAMGSMSRVPLLAEGDGGWAHLVEVVEQGAVELLLLPVAPGEKPLAFFVLGLRPGGGFRILFRDGDAVAAGQLLHRLREGEALAVLQPADGIGALAADKAMHPVAAGAHGQ